METSNECFQFLTKMMSRISLLKVCKISEWKSFSFMKFGIFLAIGKNPSTNTKRECSLMSSKWRKIFTSLVVFREEALPATSCQTTLRTAVWRYEGKCEGCSSKDLMLFTSIFASWRMASAMYDLPMPRSRKWRRTKRLSCTHWGPLLAIRPVVIH